MARLRIVLPVLAVLALAVPAPAGAADLLSARDATSFRNLQRKLGGTIGLAVSPVGTGQAVERVGSVAGGVAWSTGKVPVAMAVIAAGGASRQAANLRQAITASDNTAAERLWSSLGSPRQAARAADRQLRAAGDRSTSIESRRLRAGFTAFGQTDWTLADQARFTAGMRCVKAGRRVLDLMGQIISAHRWGLGAVGHGAQFKGGWGPGSDPGVDGGYLDRQMGVLTIGGKQVAVTIASLPGDGAHETGTRNLTAVARWFVSHVDVRDVNGSPGCG